MRNKYWIGLVPAIVLTLALAACEFDNTVTGPVRDDVISVDLDKAEQANVELNMAAGELSVRGGAAKLLEGHVEYNVPTWKPEVNVSRTAQQAFVSIKQPEHGHLGGNRRYRWDLELNDDVLFDLSLNCGAGQARLELGNLDLKNVDVHMGAGQVDLDLEGHPTHSYEVNVAGGVGQATIRLPRNVGIRAEAHGGLGSIDVRGLTKHEGYYSNDLYGNAKVNIVLKVEGGIGEIRIFG
ncbi:MAG TPA: toast rack family protein [Bryobacteraceae bacterium]|nr:toast rack family protein [Bryobacteraceae bacterium]